jgi:hypothetical protein
MFKINSILQEEMMPYCSPSCGGIDYDKENAKNRYKLFINEAKQSDLHFISIDLSCEIGYTHYLYNNAVVEHHKLATQEINKQYPTVSFTNVNKEDNYAWNGKCSQQVGQIFSHTITGSRDSLAEYLNIEKNTTQESFESQHPSYYTLATRKTTEPVYFSCDKDNIDLLRKYINNLHKSYHTVKTEIIKEKSQDEKSIKVKWFNKPCVLKVVLRGEKCEIDFIKELLKDNKLPFFIN